MLIGAARCLQAEEAVEIEYVSAPLELDFLEGSAPSAAAGAASGEDEEMPPAGGLGAAEPAAGVEGEEQPSAASDFQRILQRFGNVEELLGTAPAGGEEGEGGAGAGAAAEGGDAKAAARGEGDDDSEGEEGQGEEVVMSRKKRKLANQLKIAELKQVRCGGWPGGGLGLWWAGQAAILPPSAAGCCPSKCQWGPELPRQPHHVPTLAVLPLSPALAPPRLTLSQACERPDVVEIWDVTAVDPKLLVYLKVGRLAGQLCNAVWGGACSWRGT